MPKPVFHEPEWRSPVMLEPQTSISLSEALAVPLCVDCKHHRAEPHRSGRDAHQCDHPIYLNMVTGNDLDINCYDARKESLDDTRFNGYNYPPCGFEASLFEPKEKK